MSAYGQAQVLRDLSLEVAAGEILCLLGPQRRGQDHDDEDDHGPAAADVRAERRWLEGRSGTCPRTSEVPRRGIGYIPQGRRLFAELTVAQNLEIGLMVRKSGAGGAGRVLDSVSASARTVGAAGETLSGGEQQMLATARALCLRPKVLLLDEPTEGLQPSMIEAIRQVIVRMKTAGVAVLLVEQRVDAVLSVADRVAFIENGRNVETCRRRPCAPITTFCNVHLGV